VIDCIEILTLVSLNISTREFLFQALMILMSELIQMGLGFLDPWRQEYKQKEEQKYPTCKWTIPKTHWSIFGHNAKTPK